MSNKQFPSFAPINNIKSTSSIMSEFASHNDDNLMSIFQHRLGSGMMCVMTT